MGIAFEIAGAVSYAGGRRRPTENNPLNFAAVTTITILLREFRATNTLYMANAALPRALAD